MPNRLLKDKRIRCVSAAYGVSALPADFANRQAPPAHCRGPVQVRHVGCHAILL